MSERRRGREARDDLARRIKDQSERDGRPVTWEQARDRATDVARRTDIDLDRRR